MLAPMRLNPPYEVMGQIKAEAPEAVRFENMEKKLVEDAMAKVVRNF